MSSAWRMIPLTCVVWRGRFPTAKRGAEHGGSKVGQPGEPEPGGGLR